MTTIEHSFAQQPTAERDALFPTAQEPELTTDDIVIRSSDSYIPGSEEATEDPYELQVAELVAQEKADFQALLDFKLKSELVAQLFKTQSPDVPKGSINLTEVQAVLSTQIAQASGSYIQQATFIDTESIPSAKGRFEAPADKVSLDDKAEQPKVVIPYLEKDISLLEAREDSYLAMVSYLSEYQPTSSDALLDLTEAHIQRLLPDAQREAIDILRQQRTELKAQKEQADAQIANLEKQINVLSVELDKTRAEVDQRDIQMYDLEMQDHLAEVTQLTEHAKQLAQ